MLALKLPYRCGLVTGAGGGNLFPLISVVEIFWSENFFKKAKFGAKIPHFAKMWR